MISKIVSQDQADHPKFASNSGRPAQGSACPAQGNAPARPRRRPCRAWLLLLAAALLLAGPAPSSAQTRDAALEELLGRLKVVREGERRVVEMTLKDLLALALTRSNAVKVALIGQRIAQSRLTAALRRNRPILTNKVERGRAIRPFSGTSFRRTDDTVLSSELSKKTSSGITYGLKLEETRSRSDTLVIANEGDAPTSETFTDPDTGIITVVAPRTVSSTALTGSVNIPLIQDAGSEINDIPVRREEIGLARSRFEILQDEQSILRTMATIYWDLVDVLEQVQVEEESVRLSERLLGDNRARLRAGVISPADVKVSETQLARERQILLQFQLEGLRIEDQLRAALNLETLELGYRPVDQPAVRETEFDYKALAERMYRQNPELGILRTTLASNRYDLAEARNEDDTDLDLDLFYVFSGYSDSTFGGASDLGDTDLAGYGATLTWTVPLFDRKAEEEIQQRILEGAQIELRISDLRSNLSVQLQSALRSMRLAENEVETARISVDLANELMQNEIERFRLGRSTSFRVAEFQQDAAEARRLEILARVNYEKAFLEMLILSGDVHEFYGLPSSAR